MTITRRASSQLHVGDVAVGGGAPVSVQSMTTTKTADVDGTLAQVYALKGAGADIVRITCNDVDAAQGLAEIVPRAPVPIIADIHFQYRLALAALEAGVAGLRLNPGNIRKPEHIKAVATAALDAGVPIRVGVNAGSLDKDLLEKYGAPVPQALVDSAVNEIRLLEEVGFHDIKISVKHSNVPSMVESYRLLAETVEYPLHLGVTEAGPPPGGPDQVGGRASPPCCSRGSATPFGSRSPPTPSRRPRPVGGCSSTSGCGSAGDSTSSPAHPAAGPRST